MDLSNVFPDKRNDITGSSFAIFRTDAGKLQSFDLWSVGRKYSDTRNRFYVEPFQLIVSFRDLSDSGPNSGRSGGLCLRTVEVPGFGRYRFHAAIV